MSSSAANARDHVDWVDFEWPAKCLELPIVEQTAAITYQTASDVAEAYEAQLAAKVDSWPLCDRESATAALLTLFVADNYTGQLIDAEVDSLRPLLDHFVGFSTTVPRDEQEVGRGAKEAWEAQVAALNAKVSLREKHLRMLLVADGEPANVAVRRPGLLLAARGIAGTLPKSSIWRLRTYLRHLHCLERHAHTLFVRLAECVDALRGTDDPLVLLEVAGVQREFHQEENAAESAFKAVKCTGLVMEESAMLGVRTRWQQFQYAQSLLMAQSYLKPDTLTEKELKHTMPSIIESEKSGHDMYDRPRESVSAESLAEPPLAQVDHCIILALGSNIRNSNALFGLTTHQIQVYVERLIVDQAPQLYCVRAMALLVRARVEQHRNRVAQRSFLQMQEFLDATSQRDPMEPKLYRALSRYMWALDFPSRWSFKREFARECFEMSMFKTALKYYEDVEDWPNIIACCTALDRRRKAETKARDMIKDDPENPILWVALGEATLDEAHLWKAWELSGKKMAAPMRSLAKLALEREQWDKVSEYFDIAVSINPIFGGDWFSLGFALMKRQLFDRAAAAFTRVCQMESDNSYAWTNLGNVYVKLGKFRAAFSALSQALRHSRSNWRMWVNYFTIAVHLKEVKEATHALHTAIGIAERTLILEDQSLIDFTGIALQYLNGEIDLTGNSKGDDDAGIAAVPTATDDPEDVEVTEIAPIFEAIEQEERTLTDDTVQSKRLKDADTASIAARTAYRGRIRRVYETLQSTFVSNPEIYACCARVYGFLDGPEWEFRYRLKEVRETQQVAAWERTDALFLRATKALEALVFAGEKVATTEAKRQCLEAVDRALTCSVEHMENAAPYRDLQKLRVRVSKIKPANDGAATATAAAAAPAAAA